MEDSILDKISSKLAFIKGNLLVFSVTSGIWRFGTNLVRPFFALYVLALGGDYVSIGLIGLVGGVSIVPSLIGGHLADTKSRKKIVSIFSFLAGPVNLIYAFAPDWRFLLVGSAVNSIFYGLRGPAFTAIMADSLDPENRGKGYGVWSSLPTLPAIISPTIGGWLIAKIGTLQALRIGYGFASIVAMIAGLLRYLFLKETYQGEESEATLKESLKALVNVGKDMPKSLKILLIVNSAVIFGWMLKRRFRVTYATEVIGLTALQWGLINTIVRILRTFALPLLSSAVDRFGRKYTLFIATSLIPAMNILFIFSTGFYSAFTARAVRSVSGGIRGTSRRALRADLSPREQRGKIASIFRVTTRPFRMVAPLLGGYLYGSIQKSLPFVMEAVLSLSLLPIILLFIKEPEKKEQ